MLIDRGCVAGYRTIKFEMRSLPTGGAQGDETRGERCGLISSDDEYIHQYTNLRQETPQKNRGQKGKKM